MKTKDSYLGTILCIGLAFSFFGCTKDNVDLVLPQITEVEVLPGIDLQEFKIDQGEIGISINARDIARKGHIPTMADIRITATTGDYSQKVPFDIFTNIANISFKNEDLSEEAEKELTEGVGVTINVLDENDEVLAVKEISKLPFASNPLEEDISADDLEDLYAKVSINEDVIHFIQIVTSDRNEILGAPNSALFVNTVLLNTPIIVSQLEDLDYNSANTEIFSSYRFKEVPGEQGVFTIAAHNGDDIHYLYIVPANSELRIQSKANLIRNGGNNTGTPPNYKFKIDKVEAGLYTITPTLTGNPLSVIEDRLNAGNGNADPAYFRIISFDIDWEIQPIGSKFKQPILPPSVASEAYNNTLKNCSNNTLQHIVGSPEFIETKETLSGEEAMSISTSQDYLIPITIQGDISTSFFGVIGSINSNVSGNYIFSKSKTSISTRSGTFEETRSTEISVDRSLDIPPRTAIAVADVYQSYENVRIPYVQQFRIQGNYQENGKALTGEEITTQFTFNGFSGVITDVQNDFIEVTLRGTNVISTLFETKAISRNVAGACTN